MQPLVDNACHREAYEYPYMNFKLKSCLHCPFKQLHFYKPSNEISDGYVPLNPIYRGILGVKIKWSETMVASGA